MTKQQEIYRCNICGNTVEVLFEGDGTLVCCGEPMEHLVENLKDDEYSEKHLPYFINKNDTENILVQVGETEHPMSNEHYIKMIEIFTNNGLSRLYLQPGDKPIFSVKTNKNINYARSYCNLHGLWESKNTVN